MRLMGKKNKYGAKRKGIYDSMLEMDRHKYLLLKVAAGDITEPIIHPSYELEPGIRYKADFEYTEISAGRKITEDVKGPITERFRVIKKIWNLHGKGVLKIVTMSGGKWIETEITGKGA